MIKKATASQIPNSTRVSNYIVEPRLDEGTEIKRVLPNEESYFP